MPRIEQGDVIASSIDEAPENAAGKDEPALRGGRCSPVRVTG